MHAELKNELNYDIHSKQNNDMHNEIKKHGITKQLNNT